ncbi:uncharacterized protein METZ01_LOCUS174471 [marine metagenome]|jgi:hypothetical protein|uniref:Uncharacterized protein n=1 Tax=marine metagenome TaxID=408172 RepID=A0A382C8A8_9ZZZZ
MLRYDKRETKVTIFIWASGKKFYPESTLKFGKDRSEYRLASVAKVLDCPLRDQKKT